jgi:predicted dehydrogenase
MVEGAVHHLDILADLVGAKCVSIYAETWNPEWGEFKGDSQGLVVLRFENGERALYEGAKTNAVGLNWWGLEYVRAECRDATFVLTHRTLERFDYDPTNQRVSKPEGSGKPVPLLEQPKWANTWLIEKFTRWLDGGTPMETNVEDNLQSVAMVFAAIESSRTGLPVSVQGFLHQARQRVTQERGGDER